MGTKMDIGTAAVDILEELQLEKATIVAQITQKLVFMRVLFLILTVSTMLIVSLEVLVCDTV